MQIVIPDLILLLKIHKEQIQFHRVLRPEEVFHLTVSFEQQDLHVLM